MCRPGILSKQNPIAMGDIFVISFGNANICDANIGGTARRPSPTVKSLDKPEFEA